MRNLIFLSILIITSSCFAETDFNILSDTIADTTFLHDVKVIDEHLIVTDTIIIERDILMWHEEDIVKSNKIIEKLIIFFTITLVILSLLNHYFKNKNNGTKLH